MTNQIEVPAGDIHLAIERATCRLQTDTQHDAEKSSYETDGAEPMRRI